MLAATAAIFLQVVVIQAHSHAQGLLGAPRYERTVADHSGDHHASVGALHAQGGCIICQVFATSGQSIAPSAASISGPHNRAREAAVLALPLAPRALTHSWRSRAPPIAL